MVPTLAEGRRGYVTQDPRLYIEYPTLPVSSLDLRLLIIGIARRAHFVRGHRSC